MDQTTVKIVLTAFMALFAGIVITQALTYDRVRREGRREGLCEARGGQVVRDQCVRVMPLVTGDGGKDE